MVSSSFLIMVLRWVLAIGCILGMILAGRRALEEWAVAPLCVAVLVLMLGCNFFGGIGTAFAPFTTTVQATEDEMIHLELRRDSKGDYRLFQKDKGSYTQVADWPI